MSVKSGLRAKKDKYSRSRGGPSKFIDIGCSQSNTILLVYQKDGPGNLLRCYIDRIVWPENLANLRSNSKIRTTSDIGNLVCKTCNLLIGTPIVYEKESRLAYRMHHGAFTRTKHVGK
jgi:hypothetical protein